MRFAVELYMHDTPPFAVNSFSRGHVLGDNQPTSNRVYREKRESLKHHVVGNLGLDTSCL